MPAMKKSRLLALLGIIALTAASVSVEALARTDAFPADESCCAQDPYCAPVDKDALPLDEDCCPSGCNGCSLPCCGGMVFLRVPAVTIDMSEVSLSSPSFYRNKLSLTDPSAIYHPPRH